MKYRITGLVAGLALVAGLGAAPATAAPVAPAPTAAVVIVPTASFCQVFGWTWHCRKANPPKIVKPVPKGYVAV